MASFRTSPERRVQSKAYLGRMTSEVFVRMNDTQLCTVASAFTSMFSCVKNGILELGRSSRSHSAWIVFSTDSFQTSPERGVQNKTHLPQ